MSSSSSCTLSMGARRVGWCPFPIAGPACLSACLIVFAPPNHLNRLLKVVQLYIWTGAQAFRPLVRLTTPSHPLLLLMSRHRSACLVPCNAASRTPGQAKTNLLYVPKTSPLTSLPPSLPPSLHTASTGSRSSKEPCAAMSPVFSWLRSTEAAHTAVSSFLVPLPAILLPLHPLLPPSPA